jgi:hypothetical protein
MVVGERMLLLPERETRRDQQAERSRRGVTDPADRAVSAGSARPQNRDDDDDNWAVPWGKFVTCTGHVLAVHMARIRWASLSPSGCAKRFRLGP